MSIKSAKAALLHTTVRHETRYATAAPGSGARQMRGWSLSPIVAVTAKTIVIQFHSGRRQSIKLASGEGMGNNNVVTALHPEDLARVRAAVDGGSGGVVEPSDDCSRTDTHRTNQP